MLRKAKPRSVYILVHSFSTTSRASANHYDVLGITPKANQSDIKSAYYELSKLYHPDKSTNEADAKKFRAITEAYEVLGNIKLKKIYDKGLLGGRVNTAPMDYKPEPEPTDPTLKFYKSHTQRHVTPTMDGKTPIYNFDAWSKSHYADLFEKSKYDKDMLRKKQEKNMDSTKASQQETFIYVMVSIWALFLFLVVQGKADYDVDFVSKNREAQKPQISDVRDA